MRARWIAAAVLAAAAGGVGTTVGVRAGEALPGTTVAGVEVGGLGRADLRARLQDLGDDRTEGVLPVVAGDLRAGIDRGLVDVDLDATLERALSAGRQGPVQAVLGPLRDTGERDVDLSLAVDDAQLQSRLTELAAQVDRPATPGGFTVTGVDVLTMPPAAGRVLDQSAAVAPVSEALRAGRPDPVTLPVTVVEPGTSLVQVEQVAEAARKTLATPYTLAAGDAGLRVVPAEVAPLLRPAAADGSLALTVDGPALSALVTAKAAPLQVAPKSAVINVTSTPPVVDGKENLSWAPVPAAVEVVPGQTGRTVDVPAATTLLDGMLRAARPAGALPLVTVEPPLPTAQAAGVTSLIGSFTTYFEAGQPRAANIRRIAELVNGAYVPPGQRFSLNGTAGERTTSRGFLADSAIVDGVLVDEVGGGVSQFATTIFNAAFFAGLPIEQHKPHSFYISRYPAGRESTVYFGQLDLRFRNDTGRGMLVRTRSTPSSVTVEIYGDNGGRQVSAVHGPRRPRPDGGFLIDVTRTVSGGDGVNSTRVFKTSYDPPPPPTP